jgi:hypothetical protein
MRYATVGYTSMTYTSTTALDFYKGFTHASYKFVLKHFNGKGVVEVSSYHQTES